MKYFHLFTLAIFSAATNACSSQVDQTPAEQPSEFLAVEVNKNQTPPEFIEGEDYTTFTRTRIEDKTAFTEPVEAFSLLIPKGWTSSGDIIWRTPDQSCSGVNQYFKAQSPDGSYSYELLPNYIWSYSTNPQMAGYMQNYATENCGFGQPIDASQYLQTGLLPQLGNPKIIESKPNEAAAEALLKNTAKVNQESVQYGLGNINFYPSAVNAKVQWADGTEAWIVCSVLIMENASIDQYTGQIDKLYTCVASNQTVFKYPLAESEQAEKMLSVIMGSIRTNDMWKKSTDEYWAAVRQKRHVEHLGRMKISAERSRQSMALIKQQGDAAIARGQERLNDMDNQMRSWEARQQSSDRIQNNFIKAIREVENYQDASGTVELSAGYDHAWSRNDGNTFILSNNSNFNPSTVFQDQTWQEMQKVD